MENRLEQTNTIVGIATATGKAGVSIIRISGSKALASVQKVFYPSKPSQIKSNPIKTNQIKSHKFYYGWIKHRAEWIDEVLLVFMKAPHSYTKEDVVEIHSHGGVLITNRMLEILLSLGLKLAEKGEFTKRAFLNGRIDLTKAEAIGQLVQANSLASLSQAVNQLQGKLFEKINSFREKISWVLSLINAQIDFIEEDVFFTHLKQVKKDLQKINTELLILIDTAIKIPIKPHGTF